MSIRGCTLLFLLGLSSMAIAQETAPESAGAPPADAVAPELAAPLAIAELKPLHLETPLVEGGSAIPIVVPADGSHDADAAVIANAIEAAGGARPVPMKDDAFASGLAFEQHLIALGNRSTNMLLSALYDHHYSLTDLRYPGPGGHEVRTLHNPLGNGKNIIIIGGSDAAGVTNGTLLFSRKVGEARKTESGLVMGRMMEIQLGAGMTPPQDLEQATTWDGNAVGGGDFGWNSISKRMALYYMTGDTFHANEFLRLAFPNDQAKAELEVLDGPRIENRDAPLSGTRPEYAHRMALYWDLIEESPDFTDDDRLRVTQALAKQVAPEVIGATILAPYFVGTAREQWSSLARFSLGRYLAKDYADPRWALLRDQGAKDFNALQTQAWVVGGGEDLAQYGAGIAPVLSYLLLTGDRVPVEKGALAALLRPEEILASGRDGDRLLVQSPITFFHQAAQLTGDGRWLEYARRTGADRSNFRIGQSWWPAIAAVPPAGLVEAWQVYGMARPQWQERNTGLPQEESFHAMSYRSAPDATGDFILLDGLHAELRQPLGILELRQGGQTILEGRHNALKTRIEGLAEAAVPADAALKHQRVVGEMATAILESPNDPAAVWRRSIVNRRGHYTLLVDTLTPRVDSPSLEVQLSWETAEGDWAVGPGASALLLPGVDDAEKVPALQTSRAMSLAVAGKVATLTSTVPAVTGQPQHLFSIMGRGAVGAIACAPLGSSAAALRVPGAAVAATGAHDGLEGALVLLEPDYLYGLDLTAARELIRTNAPVEIAWDLREGIIDIITSKPTVLTLALDGPEKLRLDRTPLTGELVDGKVRITLDAGRHRITGASLSQARLDVNTAWLNDTVSKAMAENRPALATQRETTDTIRVAHMERGLSSPRIANEQ